MCEIFQFIKLLVSNFFYRRDYTHSHTHMYTHTQVHKNGVPLLFLNYSRTLPETSDPSLFPKFFSFRVNFGVREV